MLSPFNVAYTALGMAIYLTVPNLAHAEAAWNTAACASLPSSASNITTAAACAREHANWMSRVVLQYLILGYTVYSTWHYLCYQRDPPIPRTKMIARVRPDEANARDAKLTMSGCVVAALFEIVQV